ncbi:uncharacterized protein EAE97_006995 [Botrytis byssoidea]|uniref:SAP domain-containing protein n=1 Tax=Botrytis byssoidea TaxID=139641 RepID=A0A9P5LYB9_9HELO|nr:uncharacterized protein EAE97_006995 [Botrytis byssoidea]KAF7940809.1 hypothetical protein EAE97_006995 [Botrytis byssoidea]
MPPTKRPLAQADTNVILPPKKKQKEKDVTLIDDHASKSKGELVELLKERSMPSNGTKDVLIQRLRDNDGHVASRDSGKTERRKSARIDAAEQSAKMKERREEGLKDLWTVKNKALASPSAPIVETSSATSERNSAAVPPQSSHGHRINYRTKDNSKLRALLRDWRVMQPEEVESMDRMAMIERLERHEMRGYGDDYESLTCDQLSTLLSARLLPSSGVTKAARMERLRYDDALDRDNGNLEERSLYTNLVICQNEIQRYEQMLNWVYDEEGEKLYQNLGVGQLRSLVDLRQQGRKIKIVCEDSELVEWLEADDQKLARKKKVEVSSLMGCEVPEELERWEKKLADTRVELESRIGHPLPAEVSMQESFKYDVPVVTKKAGDQGALNCDPKKTNWGLFSSGELCKIAREKGAPGYGTRDAMIKWLETGILEYEDMHIESLREQCWKRLVPQYSNDDKEALIERLRILDKYEEDSEESASREASEVADAESVDEGSVDEGSVEQDDKIVSIAGPSATGTVSSDSPYAKKDNSMLRVLLRDRHLQISGTREEMIHRLETSAYNYESYTSEKLSRILKRRGFTNASRGNKALKVERLKNSDEDLCDRTNSEVMELYREAHKDDQKIKYVEAALKALAGKKISYQNLEPPALLILANNMGIQTSGDYDEIRASFRADCDERGRQISDPDYREGSIERLEFLLDMFKSESTIEKAELRRILKHPCLDVAAVIKQCDDVWVRDREIVENHESESTLKAQLDSHATKSPTPRSPKPGPRKRKPFCDHDWKDSHWANRSMRDLLDICERRGMKLHGTRAILIKYIETGEIDYEDLYVDDLKSMCEKRRIRCKSSANRLDIAKLLRETDEKEIAYRDLGVPALRKLCKEREMKVKSNEPRQDLITDLRVADERTGRV